MINGVKLLGEEAIDDAVDFANRMHHEAEEIWTGIGWKKEKQRKGILVESMKVLGDFEPSGILMMRSRGIISISAKKLYDFLISPEGFAVLDPFSSPEDHLLPPIDRYTWKDNAKLEVATTRIPKSRFMPEAEFVVLNAFDHSTLTFVSKSIIHPQKPGSSIYYKGCDAFGENVQGNPVRALNTMALKVIEIDIEKSELLVLNYADMGISNGKSAFIYNVINRNFFHPLYKRITKALKQT